MSIPRTTLGVALSALLAALALTGAVASAGAQPAAAASARDCDKRPIFVETPGRWRCQNYYMARVTLDARKQPNDDREGAKKNYVRAGEFFPIACQVHGYEPHTGKSLGLYDMLLSGHFVPDKYMRTRYTGRIPGAPHCDALAHGKWRPIPR